MYALLFSHFQFHSPAAQVETRSYMESYRTAPLITGLSRLLSIDVIATGDEGEQEVTSQEVVAVEVHRQLAQQSQEVTLQKVEAPEVEAVDMPPEPDERVLPHETAVLQQQLTAQSEKLMEENKKLTRVRPCMDCVGCTRRGCDVIAFSCYCWVFGVPDGNVVLLLFTFM